MPAPGAITNQIAELNVAVVVGFRCVRPIAIIALLRQTAINAEAFDDQLIIIGIGDTTQQIRKRECVDNVFCATG